MPNENTPNQPVSQAEESLKNAEIRNPERRKIGRYLAYTAPALIALATAKHANAGS
jgi:hypothetical protein